MTSRPIISLFLLLSMTAPRAHGINDPFATSPPEDQLSFSRGDKQLHLVSGHATSFTATAVISHYGIPRWKAFLYSGLATLGLGLAKELFLDSHFSRHDMAFTLMGIGSSALFIYSFDLFPPSPALPESRSGPGDRPS